MKVQEIINKLREQGYNVEVYNRVRKTPTGETKSDGVRIVGINGKRFSKSSSEGVTEARRILGVKLSAKKTKQLAKNRKKISRRKLTQKQKERVRKFNKEQKKVGKRGIGLVTARKRKKRAGWQSVTSALTNIDRKNKGLSYIKNVEILISRLENAITRYNFKKYGFSRVVEKLKKIKKKFPDMLLEEVYNILYRWENEQLSNEEAESIILGIINI